MGAHRSGQGAGECTESKVFCEAPEAMQLISLARNLLIKILDHFAELLVADLAVTIFVHHSD